VQSLEEFLFKMKDNLHVPGTHYCDGRTDMMKTMHLSPKCRHGMTNWTDVQWKITTNNR